MRLAVPAQRFPLEERDEKIGKTVGRRKIKDSLVYGLGLRKSLARIREEADAWMMHYMTRPRS